MKQDNTQLDDAIVKAIADGKNHQVSIVGAVRSLLREDPNNRYGQEREVDRRLQALRRKGRITYTGQSRDKGWQVTDPKATT